MYISVQENNVNGAGDSCSQSLDVPLGDESNA